MEKNVSKGPIKNESMTESFYCCYMSRCFLGLQEDDDDNFQHDVDHDRKGLFGGGASGVYSCCLWCSPDVFAE